MRSNHVPELEVPEMREVRETEDRCLSNLDRQLLGVAHEELTTLNKLASRVADLLVSADDGNKQENAILRCRVALAEARTQLEIYIELLAKMS
jgi:hypothetical protein